MSGSSRSATIATVAALLVGAVLVGSPLVLGPGREAAPIPGDLAPHGERYVSAWLPYWKAGSGLDSFTDNADLFTDLTTFFHHISGASAALEARADPRDISAAQQAAQSRGVAAIAAIIDETPPGTMSRILADPAARSAHVAAILPLVDEQGYDGIDIDYENFAFADGRATWAETRPGWVAFIEELGGQLRDRGKFLTVAVPPQFDTDNDGSSGYWVYDWPSIADHVDLLRVMTYDYSSAEPGPISPMPWVQQATEFGISTLGADKFRIGVPLYGRDWAVSQSGAGCASADIQDRVALTASQALDLAAAQDVPVEFDETSGESYFRYTEQLPDCAVGHEVHFSDARSVAGKAALAVAEGTGLALWSLGGEDPGTWDALREATSEAG